MREWGGWWSESARGRLRSGVGWLAKTAPVVATVTVAVTFAAAASTAVAYNASLAWSPVAGAAGYNVYVRQANQPYGAGTDVGPKAPDSDGVVRSVVSGLLFNVTNYFAVTSYNASRVESALSDELSLLVSATATPTPAVVFTPSPTLTVKLISGAAPTATATATLVATRTPTPTALTYTLQGHIRYYSNGEPVTAATVLLSGPTPGAAQTDTTGQFVIAAGASGTWRLQPTKSGDVGAPPTSLDAVYVLQAAVGLRTLSAAQSFACDVDGDGTVTALDAALILQYAVGSITSFPAAQLCGSNWAFIPVPQAAPNQLLIQPQLRAASCQAGAIDFQPLVAGADNQDFSAVLFGDCTGSW